MGKMGITVHKQARTKKILGSDGNVSGIELEDGGKLAAGTVILATGVRPNTVLARKAGLEVNTGIVVNNHLQTSVAEIYAAGDAVEHNGRLYGAWAPSQYQGSMAGMNACGVVAEFAGLPRANTLKVLGIDMMSIGEFEPRDGSYAVYDLMEESALAHFVFRDGRMAGAILMGRNELASRVKQAVEEGEDFSAVLVRAGSARDIDTYLTA